MRDERGVFVKTYHENIFAEHGLTTRFAEDFYTSSYKGVLRGLHFQTPPMELVKMVYCVSGKVFDAVVDLRIGSPAYGKYVTFEMSAEKANMLYLPARFGAWFFRAERKCNSDVSGHSRSFSGARFRNPLEFRWDPWPDEHPVLSRRTAISLP